MASSKENAMGWIDANKKLPGDSERVLLYTPYPVFGEDFACVGNRESIATCTVTIDRKRVKVFTHWMPLPPKPSTPR